MPYRSVSGYTSNSHIPTSAIVIGYSSALECYRLLRTQYPTDLRTVLGDFYPNDLLAALSEEDLSADSLLKPIVLPKGVGQRAHYIRTLLGLDKQLDVIVGKNSSIRNSVGINCHVWSGPLPRGLVSEIEAGVFLCSPELVFLQLGNSLSQVKMHELAYELCSNYTIAPSPGGLYYETDLPITTPERLRKVISLAGGLRGLARAKIAAESVIAGSRSPQESQQAILLGTPRSHGGYGCGPMLLNHEIALSDEARDMASRRYLVMDAYFPKAKTTVEYQGRHHNQSAARASDDARANALELMGVRTIRVWSETLYDKQKMDGVAKLIYKRSKTRLRPRSFKMDNKLSDMIDGLRESSLGRLELSQRYVAGNSLLTTLSSAA